MTGYPTSIGRSDEHTIELLGHDLAGELIGKVGFAELAFWLVALRRPTPGERRVFADSLVGLDLTAVWATVRAMGSSHRS